MSHLGRVSSDDGAPYSSILTYHLCFTHSHTCCHTRSSILTISYISVVQTLLNLVDPPFSSSSTFSIPTNFTYMHLLSQSVIIRTFNVTKPSQHPFLYLHNHTFFDATFTTDLLIFNPIIQIFSTNIP